MSVAQHFRIRRRSTDLSTPGFGCLQNRALFQATEPKPDHTSKLGDSTGAWLIASPPIGPNLGNMTEGNKPKGIGGSDLVNLIEALTGFQEWAPLCIPTHR